jgi:toxin-antitoxin system PIN domain toxin
MISVDSNLLLYAYCVSAPSHPAALAFLQSLAGREDVALSEFVLAEFYLLLRNPAVLAKPLSARAASTVIQSYRENLAWQVLEFPPRALALHDKLWLSASTAQSARRRLYDARTALALRSFGVTEFATTNVKDFARFGFARVWNPLATR